MAGRADSELRSTGERFRWLLGIDRLNTALAVVGGAACLAMMINIVVDVIGRSFFRPLPGTVDITQFAWMPVLVSLGLGYALLAGQHIRISLVTGPAGERTQRVVEIVGMAATFATFVAFAWFGAERAFASTEAGEFSSATPWLPVWFFRWVLVAGLLSISLQAVAQLIRAVTVPVFHPDDDLALESSVGDPGPSGIDAVTEGRR